MKHTLEEIKSLEEESGWAEAVMALSTDRVWREQLTSDYQAFLRESMAVRSGGFAEWMRIKSSELGSRGAQTSRV